MKEEFNPPLEKSKYVAFDVRGAGTLYVSISAHVICGENNVGFSIRSTTSRYGERYGGVLGRAEAIRLAKHILETCADITETEQQEYERFLNRDRKPSKYSRGVIKLMNLFTGGRYSNLENTN